MATKNPHSMENCPFWSALTLECRICKSGLFIPLDNHIEVYCKTTEYPQCLQYALHPENHLQIIDKSIRSNRNRRKHARIDACVKVTLVRYIHSGRIGSHRSARAKTLDLSSGGIRLTTSSPLVNKSIIEFTFDKSFPKNLQECSGYVAWCNKEIDAPGYQAGISFHDRQTVEAMDHYLSRRHQFM